MPYIRMGAPKYTEEDDSGDLSTLLTGITSLIEKGKKKQKNEALISAIQKEMGAGTVKPEYEIDAEGNVKRKYVQPKTMTEKGGLTPYQNLQVGNRQMAKDALMKSIQAALEENPGLAKTKYGAGADAATLDLMTKHNLTLQDVISGMPEKLNYKLRQQAVDELTKAGYPITDKNIQAAIEQLKTAVE